MSTPRTVRRLAAFGLVVAVALAGGAALGEAVGPIDTSEGDDHPSHSVEPVVGAGHGDAGHGGYGGWGGEHG